MLKHLCVDLEQESKEALATWVLVASELFPFITEFGIIDFDYANKNKNKKTSC
jgi:hypothetical protein